MSAQAVTRRQLLHREKDPAKLRSAALLYLEAFRGAVDAADLRGYSVQKWRDGEWRWLASGTRAFCDGYVAAIPHVNDQLIVIECSEVICWPEEAFGAPLGDGLPPGWES